MTTRAINFRLSHGDILENRPIVLNSTIIAGWTGRDPVARDKHIAELEALGVARPSSTPIHYRVSTSLLTTADEIEVVGEESSGEVEFVLLREKGRVWLGAGSDHTDRKLESYNVTMSKQLCEKPIAPELWDFEDVAQHWDSLQLRSWIQEAGKEVLYQEGSIAAILPPQDIIAGAPPGAWTDGTVMFCGTFQAKGGIRPSNRFTFELVDPVLERRIRQSYGIVALPIAG
jgi:Protein of unknown function (DUF2848)